MLVSNLLIFLIFGFLLDLFYTAFGATCAHEYKYFERKEV